MTQKIPRRVRRRRQAFRKSIAERQRLTVSGLRWFSFSLSVATKRAKEFSRSIGKSLSFECGVASIGLDMAAGRDRSVETKVSEFDRVASQILSGTNGPKIGPVWTPSITRQEPQQ